jgi:hypothetical protein
MDCKEKGSPQSTVNGDESLVSTMVGGHVDKGALN